MCLARLKGEREGIRVVREKKSEVLKNGIFRGIAKFTRHSGGKERFRTSEEMGDSKEVS